MRYRLRTLLVLMAVGPPAIAFLWFCWRELLICAAIIAMVGNLLLVRHANGWVTAYAHNEKLLVKQGDKVRRGQPIARVGSTGNVTSPQLHFEIRKGTDPVDPLEHLAVQGVDLSSADVPAARPDPE